MIDKMILELSIIQLSINLNDLISECLDENGLPKAPLKNLL